MYTKKRILKEIAKEMEKGNYVCYGEMNEKIVVVWKNRTVATVFDKSEVPYLDEIKYCQEVVDSIAKWEKRAKEVTEIKETETTDSYFNKMKIVPFVTKRTTVYLNEKLFSAYKSNKLTYKAAFKLVYAYRNNELVGVVAGLLRR